MSKQKTWITSSMVNSQAFMRLGSPAKSLLLLLLLKRDFKKISDPGRKKKTKYICTNCDDLVLTYKELNAKGWHNEKTRRAFSQLFTHGFIEHSHRGGAFEKDKSIYKLSDKWKKWKPGVSFDERVKFGRKGEFKGFKKNKTQHYKM